MDSVETLNSTPISAGRGTGQILANLATVTRTAIPPVFTHYDVAPVIDVFGNVDGRDLGGVLHDIGPIVERAKKDLPKGNSIVVRGQAQTMRASFVGLGVGLVGAIALIYLLLVVNFQSWLDPFIIITALPGALAGVVWALFLTQTTLSVPALMGAIMSLGVATANSVLVVSFARDNLLRGMKAHAAALDAGAQRIRPVLMTAAAMLIGMLPMSLGLGEGGEQNAPLGRAVIGGLFLATIATLLFVPVVFSFMHRHAPARSPADDSAAVLPAPNAPIT
jgi:multidrug efflux pump subunit AcrB